MQTHGLRAIQRQRNHPVYPALRGFTRTWTLRDDQHKELGACRNMSCQISPFLEDLKQDTSHASTAANGEPIANTRRCCLPVGGCETIESDILLKRRTIALAQCHDRSLFVVPSCLCSISSTLFQVYFSSPFLPFLASRLLHNTTTRWTYIDFPINRLLHFTPQKFKRIPRLLLFKISNDSHSTRCLSNRALRNTSTRTLSLIATATRLSTLHLFHQQILNFKLLHLHLQLPLRSSPAIPNAEEASTFPPWSLSS
ncbi:hypothetical protein AUEXF2481DRAFT_352594 [Aureobasidium subglaciale EXF-2481]|uniref:Uncharacterized protein n=1 Tax=Aureobasidium subglaciale (strain EXF-2481) TaxID=1043005 RepID=A0A074YAW8_AURSE|nr:uncharacterized protein AUEXF2481DRAFT_352594 [Aureobasidium subglaciale EXF-2481]KEQ93099.1 hypothetical protein AUEXF2481DRAFT_352594 [Aureobasidium subglaciale EXF-2481]